MHVLHLKPSSANLATLEAIVLKARALGAPDGAALRTVEHQLVGQLWQIEWEVKNAA